MKTNWINFKDLKTGLRFEQVLDFYGVKDLKLKGGQLVGFCPIPAHNGNRNSPSFSAHPEKGIFQCFGCGAKGNVLDFAVMMDKGDPARGLDVRRTALKLTKQFRSMPEVGPNENSPPSEPSPNEPTSVNVPLNFRLKDLDCSHPYLVNRGFTREVMDKFGVGFCSKGTFAGRIAIPLHDSEANLIGYAGRVIDDSAISEQRPKYVFPGSRETDGEVIAFRKSLFLYNGHRFKSPLDDLIVVEGFPAVWWLTQHGFAEAVAIMGSTASAEQIELIKSILHPHGRLWIMMDGDKAGYRCAQELSGALVVNRFCRVVVEENRQPTDYNREELKSLLGV